MKRVQARYDRSLEVLDYLKKSSIRRTKSGVMLGLGETEAEILQTMDDLRAVDCDVLTWGNIYNPQKSISLLLTSLRPKPLNDTRKLA